MITYGNLYDYIESKLDSDFSKNHKSFEYTESFCQEHNVDFDQLVKILNAFGGHNDILVLFNVADKILDDTPIDRDIETPLEFAIRHNLYTKFHEGMWVKCKKGDHGAMPDLNTSYIQMFKEMNHENL